MHEPIPTKLLERYYDAAEKAESVGAMKQLYRAEAEIGRWYINLTQEERQNEEKRSYE